MDARCICLHACQALTGSSESIYSRDEDVRELFRLGNCRHKGRLNMQRRYIAQSIILSSILIFMRLMKKWVIHLIQDSLSWLQVFYLGSGVLAPELTCSWLLKKRKK